MQIFNLRKSLLAFFLVGILASFIIVNAPTNQVSATDIPRPFVKNVAKNQLSATDIPTLYVKSDGHNFAYRILGTGSPLLLIQRLRGTMDDWDPLFLERLAQNHQVILFNNTGISSSNGKVASTITDMAVDAEHFVKALGYEQVDILGWSLGGMVAQTMAIKYPKLIRRVVLVASTPPGNPEFVPVSQAFKDIAVKENYTDEDHLKMFFANSNSSRKLGLESLQRIKKRTTDIEPLVNTDSWKTQFSAAIGWFENKENYFNKLKLIQQPILIATGRYDIALPIQNSYVLEREIPQAQLMIYPDSAHGFHHQLPIDFGDAVNNFLAQK
ncbi:MULTISPECIES: alpha/beta fold hydrolase [Nostoc]|uniref:Alpha/beta hydrolase n=1 Tax=Nostoc paludosum FACHB-159 TaxID=2692908 RepID=A0ABR8KHR2_9NOSO|nr:MULTISPECIES: alpha/beta hydrolase [Nostoc]MBD2682750.1 alpha/beta hydrolase [Nostoc sp. FACHB-857]MBD2739084.1 alpha/beta hydrolase [Nostoc paludosum FACHB-159]